MGGEVGWLPRIAATIIDAVDIRAYECLLPDAEPVAEVAARLADLIHLPSIGQDGRPMNYGLIPKGGALLDPDATLGELNLPCPLTMRLVPEISAGADDVQSPEEIEPNGLDEEPDREIVVGEPVALVHDTELDLRPDVRIDAEVHKQIEAFALANRNKECAGLLLGSVESEGKGRIIHITAAIPAESAVGTKASVRIPLVAWEEMLSERDLDYGDLRILGWFHTHAGWGVFMSDADVFIHRHFFPHPNMVAYVLDPTSGRDGFFYWHDGKIGLCPSYGLVGAPRDLKPHHRPREKPKRVEPLPTPVQPGEQSKPRRRLDLRNVAIGVLVLAALYLAFAGSPFGKRGTRRPSPLPPRGIVSTRELPAGGDRIYAIKSNDNPWRICNRAYGDGELGPYLMRYNHLKRNPCLQVGQKIKLPPKDTLTRQIRNQ
jgi:proteasome lid subunit RPN8/RPN11